MSDHHDGVLVVCVCVCLCVFTCVCVCVGGGGGGGGGVDYKGERGIRITIKNNFAIVYFKKTCLDVTKT